MTTVGKTLAFTSILFRNASDEVVARGSHTKYIALAWKDANNITEELSPRTSSEKEKKPKEGTSDSEKQIEGKQKEKEKEKEAGKNGKEKEPKAGAQKGNVPEELEKLPNVPS